MQVLIEQMDHSRELILIFVISLQTVQNVAKVIYNKACIILARMHSSSDVMHGRLDFSSIYIIRQLQHP